MDGEVIVSIPFKRESISELTMIIHSAFLDALVSIPFKRESISEHTYGDSTITEYQFQFPSNGKAYLNFPSSHVLLFTHFRFNSLQTGKHIWTAPNLHPVGPWLRNAKTKRELREAFFTSKFTPKIPKTHVCIDPNAIF